MKARDRGDVATMWIIGIALVAAWLTHIEASLNAGQLGFFMAGAIIFPVGIVHGIGIWFGAW